MRMLAQRTVVSSQRTLNLQGGRQRAGLRLYLSGRTETADILVIPAVY